MNYQFALKFLGWNKIYTTKGFQVSPVTDGIYGPILDSASGTKGVLAADYYPYLDPKTIKYEQELDLISLDMTPTPANFKLFGNAQLIADILDTTTVFAELNTTIAATGTPSIVVKSKGSVFPSGAQFVTIGQETWKVSSRTGNTFTATQRGVFGSFSEKHVVSADNPIFVTPLSIGQSGRGAELWIQTIDESGQVVSLTTCWQGFVEYVRMGEGNFIEVVCKDSLGRLKQQSDYIHMISPTSARSKGFDKSIVSWRLEQDKHNVGEDSRGELFPLADQPTSVTDYYNKTKISGDTFLKSIFGSVAQHMFDDHAWTLDDMYSFNRRFDSYGTKFYGNFLSKDSISDWGDGSDMEVWYDKQVEKISPKKAELNLTARNYHMLEIVKDPEKYKTMQVLHESETDTQEKYLSVDNAYNTEFMDYITPVGTIDTALLNNICKTTIKIPDAIKIYDDIDTSHVWLKLRGKYPTGYINPGEFCSLRGICYIDQIQYTPERRDDVVYDFEEGAAWEYGTLVESKDYISGLYHGFWKKYSRFFNASIEDQCSAVELPIQSIFVTSPLFRRFDIPSNEKTLGDELIDNTLFFDYYFSYDDEGTISVRNFADDIVNTVPDITLTSADYIEKPTFSQDSSLINQVSVKSKGFLNENNLKKIVDYQSIKKFGARKVKDVELTDTIFDFYYHAAPKVFDNILSEKYLRRFSGVRNIVEVKLPITFYTAQIGQTVQLTDWITPNSTGVIGGSGELYTIFRKEVNWSSGYVALKLVLFPGYKQLSGVGNIIPAAKVEYIDGVDLYLESEYVNAGTMQDYSDSSSSSYPFTSGDRGTGWFATGYKVVLTNRTDTDWYQEMFTVSSIDPSTYKITLTTTPGSYWTDAISNGEWVDIHYANADNVVSLQKLYTYIGSESTGFVDTANTNPNKKYRS